MMGKSKKTTTVKSILERLVKNKDKYEGSRIYKKVINLIK